MRDKVLQDRFDRLNARLVAPFYDIEEYLEELNILVKEIEQYSYDEGFKDCDKCSRY